MGQFSAVNGICQLKVAVVSYKWKITVISSKCQF